MMLFTFKCNPYSKRKKISIVGFCFLLCIFIHHFTQDSNYQVPGWELNVSRNTSLYVNPDKNTLIISPKLLCKRPYLFIIVHSAVANKEARLAIRNTWANNQNAYFKFLNVTIEIAFLLGKSKNNTLNTLVLGESSEYGDIIQEDFIDTYNNLTIKSVMMLKWFKAKCPRATFIMKTDDDSYVNIPGLVKVLKKSNTSGLLMGYLYINSWRITDPKSKWYVPKYMFSEKIYPNFMSGAGYVMSLDVGLKLYETALITPLLHMEDVYLTGICAKKAKLSHINHPGFGYSHSFLSNYFMRLEDAIVVHYTNVSEMYRIWNKTL